MEAVDLGNLFILRSIERLFGVFIGGASIYLGYQLFLRIPKPTEGGEGKFNLPGGISIYISRVGPGVFFALFGSALVAFSFLNPLNISTPGTTDATSTSSDTPSESTSFSYVTGETSVVQLDQDQAAVKRDMRMLRKLELALEKEVVTLPRSDADSILIALPRIKRMMLHSVWDESWGDYQLFADWIRSGAPSPPPAGLMEAVYIFNGED